MSVIRHYAYVESLTKETFEQYPNSQEAKRILFKKLGNNYNLAMQLASCLEPSETSRPITIATSSERLYSLLVSAVCADPELKLDLFIEGADYSFTNHRTTTLRDRLDIHTCTSWRLMNAPRRGLAKYDPKDRAVVVILGASKHRGGELADKLISELLKLDNAAEAEICIEDNSFIFNGRHYGQTDSSLTAEQSEKISSLESIVDWAFSNHEDEHEARMAILSQLRYSKFGTQVVKNIARSLRPCNGHRVIITQDSNNILEILICIVCTEPSLSIDLYVENESGHIIQQKIPNLSKHLNLRSISAETLASSIETTSRSKFAPANVSVIIRNADRLNSPISPDLATVLYSLLHTNNAILTTMSELFGEFQFSFNGRIFYKND